MSKKTHSDNKKFEDQFYKVVKLNDVKKMEKFLLTSDFKTYSQKYKQSVMDHLVCGGYKQEELAKWALTNTTVDIRGDIHENADRPLRIAAKENVEFAKYLLTSPDLTEKANINATNDGSSALLRAIEANNLNFVKYLITSPELEKKARLDVGKKEFDDALCKACDVNHTEMVKYLLGPEGYPNPKKFNAKKNIARFDYAAFKKMLGRDNVELVKFVQNNHLLDINQNLNDWFCMAVISDAKQVASYLEEFFEEKPILNQLQFKGESLFFKVAQANHYARSQNHFYFNAMIEEASSLLTKEDLKKMSHFYVYNEAQGSAQPLMEILEVYFEKNKISSNLKTPLLKKEIHKI